MRWQIKVLLLSIFSLAAGVLVPKTPSGLTPRIICHGINYTHDPSQWCYSDSNQWVATPQ
jgi:hypothetical protein